MIAIVLLAAAAATPLTAQDAAARFGAREAVDRVSISPDGTKVAMIVPARGSGTSVAVVDIASDPVVRIISSSSGNPERYVDCSWLTGTTMACRIAGHVEGADARLVFDRFVVLDSKGGTPRMLSSDAGDAALTVMQSGGGIVDLSGPGDDGAQILMTRQYVPQNTIGSNIRRDRRGVGVDAVDVRTLRRRPIEAPRPAAVDYISDGHGAVRIMGVAGERADYADGTFNYFYRRKGSRQWQPLGTVRSTATGITGFYPYAVDRKADVVYGFDDEGGRRALVRVSLDGQRRREVVLARPDVDVDQLVQLGRQRRVVGVGYATEKRIVDYFDPDVEALRAALEKAMPGKQVTIVDATLDEGRLVLFVGSDVDPGRYYVYTKSTRKLEELLPVRPSLASVPLSPVRSITYRAADGTVVPAYLTLPIGSTGKNLPAIVLPHGGPSSRDEWGFDWLSQFFANRGYAVLQPQYRGSAGYGDAWFQKNGFQSWRTAIGDVNDAGRYLIAAGIADASRLAIMGWSYGGYAALQSPALDPQLFKAIIAVAPVTDLDMLRGESRQYSNFTLVDRFIGHGEHVATGSPARNVERIVAPVLLFHGSIDDNVGVGESRLMADRLRGAGKKVDYVEFKGLDHYLIDTAARTEMLQRSDAFLRQSLGM